MTPAEKIAEINRLLGIFNQGCSNTCVPPAPATECEECTADVLRRIEAVLRDEPPPREAVPGDIFLTGAVVTEADGKVTVRRADGTTITFPGRLVPADQLGDGFVPISFKFEGEGDYAPSPAPAPFLCVTNDPLRFKYRLQEGEEVHHGDLIVLDRGTGLIRQARPDDTQQRFIVGPNALITSGYIEMDMP